MEQIYAIKKEQEVRFWLERRPGTRTMLQQIPGVIAEFFPDADLRLEVRTDPESVSDEGLGIYIRTGMESEGAVEQLLALDAAWGDRLHDLTDGALFLNVETRA